MLTRKFITSQNHSRLLSKLEEEQQKVATHRTEEEEASHRVTVWFAVMRTADVI